MLQNLTFDAFKIEQFGLSSGIMIILRNAFENCREYATNPEGWLLLRGPYGCGKTHLAASIANARIAKGESAIFMVVPDLLDHLRSTYNPNSEVSYDEFFEKLRDTPLLILDDLGTQSSTPWAQEKLFQLLNHRYGAHLPTVITTNQRVEDFEPRLRSRLSDENLVIDIQINAPDYRMGKNSTKPTLSSLHLHRDQTFENFGDRRNELSASEYVNLETISSHCQYFAKNPEGWIVLSGPNGTGKTHLAAAIANTITRDSGDEFGVMFVVIPDLLDHLRSAFSPQSNISYDRLFDEVKKTPLLILDDIGTESATPWAKEKLFQLLNYRHSAMQPTVITTSSDPDNIEPWLRTRMFDTRRCKFCALEIPSFLRSRAEGNVRSRTAYSNRQRKK